MPPTCTVAKAATMGAASVAGEAVVEGAVSAADEAGVEGVAEASFRISSGMLPSVVGAKGCLANAASPGFTIRYIVI